MDTPLVVVFGLPGAGKSYVAEILGKHFGYFVYDGDNDIPAYMHDALNRKVVITNEMRSEFLERMIVSVKKLSSLHNKLVIHQTFLKEFMRRRFLEAFPRTRFFLVEVDTHIREERYVKRAYFNLGLEYLRHMSGLFEQPVTAHEKIRNDTNGHEEILRQLSVLL